MAAPAITLKSDNVDVKYGTSFDPKSNLASAIDNLDGDVTGKVEITSQNHGFAVDIDSLKDTRLEMTHQALNDKSCEGVRHKDYPCFAVQYHPEASAGPEDSRYLFDQFIELMEENKNA